MKEKDKLVLPAIVGVRKETKAPSETGGGGTTSRSNDTKESVQPGTLPPVNYYYVSGRYQICSGGFWNPDLNADYSKWVKHRKHINEMRQQIDNQGMTEAHTRYMKFRRRIRKIQNQFQKSELKRQNDEIYKRVNKAKTDVDDTKDAFTEYVENAIKKRYEYGRYLFQKKITRENTAMEMRVKAARPWATAEGFAEHYAKLRKKGSTFQKFKNLEDLKVVMQRHGDTTSISAGRSLQRLSLNSNDKKEEENENNNKPASKEHKETSKRQKHGKNEPTSQQKQQEPTANNKT